MHKMYVYDTHVPSYSLYEAKPDGCHTDEIDLTDEELKFIKESLGLFSEAQDLIWSKLIDKAATRIEFASRMQPRIEFKSKTHPKIDLASVAEDLGAEPVDMR